MLKLKTTLFLLTFFLVQIAICQDNFLRAGVGINRSNVLLNPSDIFSLEDEFKTGFQVNVTYNFKLNELFYWGTGLGYIQKGFKSEVALFDEFANQQGIAILDWRFNYVGLPTYVGIQTGNNYFFFAELGLTPGILTSSKLKFPDILGQGNNNSNVTEFIDDFDLSVYTSLGIRKNLSKTYSLDFGVSFQQSLIGIEFANVQGRDTSNHHITVAFSVGLIYLM